MEPVQHPFHGHPLVLVSQESHSPDEQYSCSGCAAPILLGPIFVCSLECGFSLHKSCAELPTEITNFLHTQHPLILQEESTCEFGSICDHCEESINGFLYRCSICNFDLDILCASLKSIYTEPPEEEDHKHKFMVVKPSVFACDICGKESEGRSYLCVTCQLRVHPTCSFLPRVVKFFTHSCPLKLTFGHQLEKPIDKIKQSCRTCFEKLVDARYGFYYCVDCEYIADIQCAMGNEHRDYQFDAESYSPTRRYKDEGKIDLQNWHEHGLILCKDEPATTNTTDGQVVVCRGCVSEISSGPFYECKEKCGYVLDESCANLYEKRRHPFHGENHDLVLLDKGPFFCGLCALACNGFGYFCKEEGCELVKMDIKCALRQVVIRIERAHQHPLRIIDEGKYLDKKCKGCSSGCDRIRYSCSDCGYNLCYRCVGLPTSAKHGWDEHPLELTCESTPHEDGEYYCDECEEPRDKDHWFYHCAICERDVHTKCMGLHNLDLGITYTMTEAHPIPGHRLIIMANPQVHPTCGTCGLPCKDLYYQCTNCEFRTHFLLCTPVN